MSPQPTFHAGLVNLPTTPAARAKLLALLQKDYETHHCFENAYTFVNHLPHHLVAAYDMGATPEYLQAIYDEEAPKLQAINKQGADINEGNWTSRLGEQAAYGSYLAFFMQQIEKHGVSKTLAEYIFSDKANLNGVGMCPKFLAALVHPFLAVSWGVEFGVDFMIASGLGQCAITKSAKPDFLFDATTGFPSLVGDAVPGTTLLQLLREVYDSDILKPAMPYSATDKIPQRLGAVFATPERGEEIKRIYSKWSLDLSASPAEIEADVEKKIEEFFFQATLLLAGCGKRNYAPRVDFFLMHTLTSALCLPSILAVVPDPRHKAMLLQGYARTLVLYMLIRGRPRINIPLVMSYTDNPKPPHNFPTPANPPFGTSTNPWLAMIHNAFHQSDPHVLKSIRALYYAARKYGASTAVGQVVGGKDEYHEGAGSVLDGSVFVRAAGVLSGTLGWIAYGEKQGNWDMSGLGWDGAWEGDVPL